MFGIFKSRKDKLEEKYRKKLEESFKMSKVNRSASDALVAEAEKIREEIELLKLK